MADYFRVKIVSKRQVTLPQLMLRDLHLEEGDELEFEVESGKIRAVRALKVVPAEYFPPDVLEMIRQRRQEMAAGINDGEAAPPALLAEEPIQIVVEAFEADRFAIGKAAKVAHEDTAGASSR